MDNKVILDCPLCSTKELYVSMGDDGNGLQQCINCGYSTNDDFLMGDIASKRDHIEFKSLDEFMQKYSIVKNDYIWIPSVMQLPIGIYYPADKDNNLTWFFAPIVDIPKSKQKNYPSSEGGYYKQRYDMEKQLEFKKFGEGIVEINTIMGILDSNKKVKDGKKKTKSSKS
jgi:Zn ribbon nucleic-acid-binding protein